MQLTGGLIVVDIDAFQLQRAVANILAFWVHAMFVRDDLPKLYKISNNVSTFLKKKHILQHKKGIMTQKKKEKLVKTGEIASCSYGNRTETADR